MGRERRMRKSGATRRLSSEIGELRPHRDWVEDIIVDGFPPTEPGGCPALICPECGRQFLWDASVPERESYLKPESG